MGSDKERKIYSAFELSDDEVLAAFERIRVQRNLELEEAIKVATGAAVNIEDRLGFIDEFKDRLLRIIDKRGL